MRYISFNFEDEKYWIELNNDNVAYREIILSNDCYHVSALEDCLAEGEFVDEEIEAEIKDITQTEFEQIWDDAMREHSEKWGETKNKYKINDCLTATLIYYYPQGAIFKCDDILVLYNGEREFYLHEQTMLRIVGYDDTNMWVVAE